MSSKHIEVQPPLVDSPIRQNKRQRGISWGLIVGFGVVFLLGVGLGRSGMRWQLHGVRSTNSSLPANLDYASVDEVYDLIKKDFDGKLNQEQLLDGIKEGLAKSTGDQYTEYFNPKDSKSFNDALSGSFEGIGAELGKEGGNIIIVSPLSGYPAEKAGLKPKDAIIKINGETLSDSTIGEAVNKIRGPKDSKVTLTIGRGEQKPFDVTITRAEIKVASVESKVEDSIGYLKVSQFGNDTVALAQQAAKSFKNQNVKGIVLDLRGDPGGYLDGAVNISSLWLGKGQKVVDERRGNQLLSSQYAHGQATLEGLPTVVLIDGGSASASEITAGALSDNKVATLVGEKSFGKGSVQQVESLPNGASIKITVARWYTPNGRNIDKHGIEPEVKVSVSEQDIEAKRDPQKDKAYELIRQKIQ